MIRALVALGAVIDLLVVRVLPETGGGLYFRLAAATILVLVPGGLIAEALGRRSASATLAWSLAALFASLTVTFALGLSLRSTLVLLALIAVVALGFAVRVRRPARIPGSALVGAAGVVLGLALWHVAGNVDGDALFHLARVRKLDALGSLHLRAVDEFRDGGLHPGYAFPLWHGFLAVIARLAGVDPERVVLHEASVLAPIAGLVAYEAGFRLFASRAAAAAVALAQVGLIALAPGHGGAYRVLGLPATAARQLLVLAALALVFEALDEPGPRAWASVAAAGLALTLVHPTYAIFLLIPLGGFFAARVLLAAEEVKPLAAALAAFALPAGAVLAWLLPVVRETASHDPSAKLRCGAAHGVARYAGQLDVSSCHSFRLAPEVIARGGAIAVAALVLVPLAAFARRSRWGAYVLGGTLAVLVLMLVPFLFTRFSDAVSLSQSRRAAGFVPFAFALAGGIAVLARRLGVLALPAALAAGIALQLAWPGDFGYRLEHGGPALATWIALLGAALGLAAAATRRLPQWERTGWTLGAAAALFVLPVAVHAMRTWSAPPTADVRFPSPLLRALHPGDVVFSDVETSYRLAAAAPVYVASAPPAHVADTRPNRPYARARDTKAFLAEGNLAIPRRYGARWIVLDRRRTAVALSLTPVYSGPRYSLYRLS